MSAAASSSASKKLLGHVSEAVSDSADDASGKQEIVTAASAAPPKPNPAKAATAATLSKQTLYKQDATVSDLFGTLDGELLWSAIQDAYKAANYFGHGVGLPF
jgi:hypothetical protein